MSRQKKNNSNALESLRLCLGDGKAVESRPEELVAQFTQLAAADQLQLLNWLCLEFATQPALAGESGYAALLRTLLATVEARAFDVADSFWLAPNVLYFDGVTDKPGQLLEPVLLLVTSTAVFAQRSHYVQTSNSGFACAAVFPIDMNSSLDDDAACFWLAGDQLLAINNLNPLPAPALEFVDYLSAQAPHTIEPIRNIVCTALVEFCPETQRASHAAIIRKLQLMVSLPLVSCNDVANPFCLHIDILIPLGPSGVFVSGWMHDPLQLLQSVSMTTAFCSVSDVQNFSTVFQGPM